MTDDSQANEPVAATTADDLPASDESPEKPKSAESAPAVNDTDEKKPSEGFTRRIDELTKDYRTEQRRALAAEQREQELLSRLERMAPKPAPEPEIPTKTLADFQYDETKYQTYVAQVVRAEARAEAGRVAKEEIATQRQRESNQVRLDEFLESEETFAKDLPDYYEVTRNELLPLIEGTPLFETVMDSEHAHALTYYLGKNLRIAQQISRLPPLQQAREIGRLETRLADKPKTPKVSEAPPPAAKIEAAAESIAGIRADSPDSDKLPADEWMKRRNRELSRKKKA